MPEQGPWLPYGGFARGGPGFAYRGSYGIPGARHPSVEPYDPPAMNRSVSSRQRPWRLLVLAVVIMIGGLLALALWSEREDARRLPPDELQGVEEGFGGPL